MFISIYIIFKIYDVEKFQTSSNSATELDRFTGNTYMGISDSTNVINSNYTESPKTNCIKPTKNNPFMNFLPLTKATDKKACPVTKKIEEETLRLETKYPTLDNLYRPKSKLLPYAYLSNPFDTDDTLNNWLYKVPVSCKLGNTTNTKGNFGCSIVTHIG